MSSIKVQNPKGYDRKFYARHREQKFALSAERILPIVIKFLSPCYKIRSAIDVGCGVGVWLHVLNKIQDMENIKGIDGGWVDKDILAIADKDFIEADLSKEFPELNGKFDLAISLEVAEHLPPERAENFVEYLTGLSDFVLFSAAIPFQDGTNHFNEQWQDYWVNLFEKWEFIPFDIVRPEIWNNKEIPLWYKQNTILYVKKNKMPEINPSTKQIISLVHPDCYQNALNYSMKRIFWRGLFRNALKKSLKRILGHLIRTGSTTERGKTS